MQEHPIPRQITTFEFKLIGELTIKQFGFLAFGVALAALLFFLAPKIFFLNFILAAVPAVLGIGFAFVPVNDRPMDVWLRNLFRRLSSPTQYFYRKHNPPPKILLGLQLPPREVLLQHIKAQQSLNEYLQKKPKTGAADNMNQIGQNLAKKQQDLQALMANRTGSVAVPVSVPEITVATESNPVNDHTPIQVNQIQQTEPLTNLSGVVLTPNGIPLANQMVYLKQGAETVRLFKTNAQGQFQNNLPLSQGEYFLEIQDPQKKHDFARMKVNSQTGNLQIFAQK
ncbi:hypothetical protein A2313_04280 [Candidatus Roizmanbacteria bacterium RIFOXYB2_FULL_41_10]|uniref:PrgI family protein n=1 Tax=Candidatus Roizmanbacteria bacterium RIFOXYA1_FULL_41_12 TaxID=1802082 RepID=A0A1F7KFA2_9BACT|nr:MAG: hypothetical protein A2262_01460 [Candidatus Roizmanbacteria bacterium RIFOXYA2_FULL_41_8]OGK66527.1 MAG: hypothetical protein A2209_00820 [Candidatus Roizmanbacteria bacterium RIFOXYA1_FULL_41_12]OGK71756.1 MAG: hypothetical protein A2403_00130 [Candidatus Roizmanbacteria bacterium RIFOXYC1_FULL_41_16]OGK72152.1 MAG: hypothetical protein A2313_04280 [Candidatus Roizmanbacteria bacterium RIFOXYB2_FULL_41_10]OGK74813.1 MAG: hypothetical protein A2575_00510 [Candidatus Roizmanbacteria bac